MRIATWNVERLKHKANLCDMICRCKQAQADIFVLAETDNRLKLDYKHCIETPLMVEVMPGYYGTGDNRVTIYTNYPVISRRDIYDKYTALCVELKTERGNLLVYGTIMGVYGSRNIEYKESLPKQMEDIRRLSATGCDICVIGDYNCTFADNYYYTQYGRDTVMQTFDECGVEILTRGVPECVDHIAVTRRFIGDSEVTAHEWNYDKALSDHKGIVVEF